MKKQVIVYIFLTITSLSYNKLFSQSSREDKLEYKGKGFYMIQKDANGKETNKVPWGKEVMVTYDKFFKSYSILYIDENDKINISNLSYISEEKVKDLNTSRLRMKDKHGNYFQVIDMIQQIGNLYVIPEAQMNKNGSVWLVAENLKVDNTKY